VVIVVCLVIVVVVAIVVHQDLADIVVRMVRLHFQGIVERVVIQVRVVILVAVVIQAHQA